MEHILTTQDPLLTAIWATPAECDGQYQLFAIENKTVKPYPLQRNQDISVICNQLCDNGSDVYFAMARFTDESSRKGINAIGASAFWMDIDCGADKVNGGKGYLKKNDAKDALFAFCKTANLPAPSFIVDSGNGLHVYFVLDREIPKSEWKLTAAKLKTLTHHQNFLVDDSRTTDIASVLRVPDTKNYKDSANPKDVKLKHIGAVMGAKSFIDAIDAAYSKLENASSRDKSGIEKNAYIHEPYPFIPENALEILDAARVAFPDGIRSQESFFTIAGALSALVSMHGWPESEAKAILDEICSKPEIANRTSNDSQWSALIVSTPTKVTSNEKIITYERLFKLAENNGWHRKIKKSDALLAVQSKFALISLGGKVGVVDREDLATKNIDGSAASLVVMNRSDGSLLIQRFLASEYTQVDSKNILQTFIHDKNTVMYKGVEFNPRSTSESTLNLWVGMTAKPMIGKWPLIESLLRDVLCGGRDSEYQYLLKYIAHAIQRPWEKPGVMIILLGGQGIGKGTLAKLLKRIWSATFLQVNRIKQVVGDFNGSLERAYIVFLDEALFAGDRNSSDALKSLVTESNISINEKHQPARQITSYHRFFSATNAEHFKSTDRDDRRDFVLRVSEKRKGDYEFWDAVNAEIDSEGVQAFVYDLMNMDLTGFNVRSKPNTRELTEQKLQSLERFPRWWFDCLSQGLFGNGGEWPEFVSSQSIIQLFLGADQNTRTYKQFIDRDLVSLMTKICPSAQREQRMDGIHRRRGYALPSIEVARENFEKYIGDSLEWEVN